ncbi:hypothetical protein Tco_0592593 [Tanacetum coccineum]
MSFLCPVTAPPGFVDTSATLVACDAATQFNLLGRPKLDYIQSHHLSREFTRRPMHLSSHSTGPSHTPLLEVYEDYMIHSEASIEEDAEVGLTRTGVDMELGIGDGDEVGDHVEIDHRDARTMKSLVPGLTYAALQKMIDYTS